MPPEYKGDEPGRLREYATAAGTAATTISDGVAVFDKLPDAERFTGQTATEIGGSWQHLGARYRAMADDLLRDKAAYNDLAEWVGGRLKKIEASRLDCQAEHEKRAREYGELSIEAGRCYSGTDPAAVAEDDARRHRIAQRQAVLSHEMQRLTPGWGDYDVEWIELAKEFKG